SEAVGTAMEGAEQAAARAGTDAGNAYVRNLGARIRVFRQELAGELELGRDIRQVGRDLTLFVTAPIVGVGVGAIRSAAQIDALERGLAAIVGSAAEARRQLVDLEEVAELPGIGFREAVRGAANLQLLKLSADETTRAVRAVGEAVARHGGRAE